MGTQARSRFGWRLGAAFVAALGALALLPPTTLAKKLPRAKFKLSVSGTQKTTFSNRDPGCNGSGEENVSFATPSPLKVTVVLVKAEGERAPTFNFGKVPSNGFGDSIFAVNATVHRAQTWTATAGCTFADTRSCEATAHPAWRLSIFGTFAEDNTIGIEDDPFGGNQDDPLAGSCPEPEAFGSYYPVLLSYDPAANEYLVKGALAEKKILKKKKKKLTSNGQGTAHVELFDETSDTTTKWTVALKRLKGK